MGFKAKAGDNGMTEQQTKVLLFNEMARRTPVEARVIASRAKGEKVYPACHPKGHGK